MLIVEDAHWADDATLDVLGYAARRVESKPALLVLTVRDEAVDPHHPLHRLYGMMAGSPLRRLELERLSRDAVGALAAGTGRDADAVHALTRGNPFFVAEALAAPPDEVPVTSRTRCWRGCGCSRPSAATRSIASRSCRRRSPPTWRRRWGRSTRWRRPSWRA